MQNARINGQLIFAQKIFKLPLFKTSCYQANSDDVTVTQNVTARISLPRVSVPVAADRDITLFFYQSVRLSIQHRYCV